MAKPIFFYDAINAFDAKKVRTFKLKWSGNQSVKTSVIIRNNTTNNEVYSGTQEGFQLKYELPANKLTNGVTYNIIAKVTDARGNDSEWSDLIIFRCISTPLFSLNIIDNQVIGNSSYDFKITYSQLEGELLQNYQVYLFNNNKSQIYTSGLEYNTDSPLTYYGLEDNGRYYAKATGVTINGLELTTELIPFSVNYIQPIAYSYLHPENRYDYGDIKLQSNLISIEGRTCNGQDPVFIEGTAVDARNNCIIFDDNLFIKDNFTLCFTHSNFEMYKKGLIISNGNASLIVAKQSGRFDKSNCNLITYFDLTITNGNLSYYIMSNFINTPKDNDLITVWIRKKNGLFDIYIKNESEVNA